MRVQGFINVYPAGEEEAKGTTYGKHKTGNGIFTTLYEANAKALPSRLAVAEFEYVTPSYRNLYKGSPWDILDTDITLGHGKFESEEAAQAAIDATPVWAPYLIGIVKISK